MKRFVLLAAAICLPLSLTIADLTIGQSYRISATDVDGNALSTADGHMTTVVLTTQSGIDKARAVGDRTPDFCLGNPIYRMITVVVFEKQHSKPTRMILSAVMRHRLDSEARLLQNRYTKLQIPRDARRDVFAVADFGGAIAKQLGSEPAAGLFRLFVLGKTGELIKEWSDIPSAEDLAAALKQN